MRGCVTDCYMMCRRFSSGCERVRNGMRKGIRELASIAPDNAVGILTPRINDRPFSRAILAATVFAPERGVRDK